VHGTAPHTLGGIRILRTADDEILHEGVFHDDNGLIGESLSKMERKTKAKEG
jgi:hypothetical protein